MNFKKLRLLVYFVVITLLALYLAANEAWVGVAVMAALFLLGIMIILFPNSNMEEDDDDFYDDTDEPHPHNTFKRDHLVYYGDQLSFNDEDVNEILEKHSPYFTQCNDDDKKKFIKRVISFIDDKTFNIYDKSGFREMPVLISASAIQVSFGLEKYILPHFTYINIHPVEFIDVQKTIRFLEGNVSGNSINISWKYFIEGFQFPRDGKNVGLHEMAHAYYYQNFGPCENKDEMFIKAFDKVSVCGNKIFQDPYNLTYGLYSDYSKRNFQEFWAESIEIFFEKSMEMKNTYPYLYHSISELLNQDPTNVNYQLY